MQRYLVKIMGRFISIFSIFESIGIIFLTIVFGIDAQLISLQLTVIIGSIILLEYVFGYCIAFREHQIIKWELFEGEMIFLSNLM